MIAAAVCVWTCLALLESLRNPYHAAWWSYLGVCAPAVTGFWLAIEPLWRSDRSRVIKRFFFRQMVTGWSFVVANEIVHVIIARGAAARNVRDFPDYRIPTAAGQLLQGVMAFGLLGAAASLMGGGLALIVVVVPVMSVTTPEKFATMNLLSTSPEDLRAARNSGLLLSLLSLLVFLIPTLLVVGDHASDDSWRVWMFWAGVLLAPGLIALTVIVRMVQRVDPNVTWLQRRLWWR